MGADYIETSIYIRKGGVLDVENDLDKLELWALLMDNPQLCELDTIVANDYSEVLCDKLYDYCESVGHDFEAILPATVAAGFYETVYNFYVGHDLLAHREAQVEEVGDDWYLVKTGGMSWGDSPTDIFDVIVGLAQLPDIVQDWWGVSTAPPPQVLRLVPSVDEVACSPVTSADGQEATQVSTSVTCTVNGTDVSVEVVLTVRAGEDGSITVVPSTV